MKTKSRRSKPAFSLSLAFLLVLLAHSVSFAGVETVVIENVQFSKTLGGVVVDPTDSPLAAVEVIEVSSDWQTVVRSTRTDATGRWSLPPVPKQRVYYLRFITKECCFNEVQCRLTLNRRKGKELRIHLPLST
jgi:hypothetical protein